MVVGMFPSGGIFADVLRGQYELPEGISLQIPTERFTNPDGSLFLEGAGVAPTVRVPVTEATVLTDDDVVLRAAEDAIFGVSPDDLKLEGGPVLASPQSTLAALRGSLQPLEAVAQEEYGAAALAEVPATFQYTIRLDNDRRLAWGWGWCATTAEILAQNFEHIRLEMFVNGQPIDLKYFAEVEQTPSGFACQSYYTVVYRWPSGETQLEVRVTFTEPINDGQGDYPAGVQTFKYSVTLP